MSTSPINTYLLRPFDQANQGYRLTKSIGVAHLAGAGRYHLVMVPIDMTRAKLLARRGNRLLVGGLDARDGSPVPDIRSG